MLFLRVFSCAGMIAARVARGRGVVGDMFRGDWDEV